MNPSRKKFFAACILITIGFVSRFAFAGHPNVELVTAVSLLSAVMLGGYYGIIIPLAVVALSDITIGNDIILIYTWSAWLIIGAFGLLIRKYTHLNTKSYGKFLFGMTGLGILSTLFFYGWTNFGVWQLFNYYPRGFSGLMASYVAGLPFLRNQLMGNIIFVPVLSTCFMLVWKGAKQTLQQHIALQKK